MKSCQWVLLAFELKKLMVFSGVTSSSNGFAKPKPPEEQQFCKAKTARRTIVQNLMVFSGVLRTWWLRWGSSGFFPPGGLANLKLIGVGLTVTGPGARPPMGCHSARRGIHAEQITLGELSWQIGTISCYLQNP